MASQWVSLDSSPSVSSPVVNLMPIYGLISIQGLSVNMNDRWFVGENFCQADFIGGVPLHFFAVYDGHGSYHVSSLCQNSMHTFVAEELMRIPIISRDSNNGGDDASTLSLTQFSYQQGWEDLMQGALKNSFKRMDQVALDTCSCNGVSKIGRCHSFLCKISGSTANVVILSLHHIIVANCGVSRVVLCRSGKAIPLSQDHKTDRLDELLRIYGVGGKIINRDGPRVSGIVNTTRAIGNSHLKSIIISEPEITIAKREVEDEFLILATDGLWNAMPDDLACETVSSCLKDESPIDPVMFPTKSKFAASILARLALRRGSQDNITVIVIDLSKG